MHQWSSFGRSYLPRCHGKILLVVELDQVLAASASSIEVVQMQKCEGQFALADPILIQSREPGLNGALYRDARLTKKCTVLLSHLISAQSGTPKSL